MVQGLQPVLPNYFATTMLILFIILVLVAILITQVLLFRKKRYSFAIGGIIGSILAVINIFTAGLLGVFFYIPFIPITRLICSGEECWGWMIIVGSMGFLVSGYLIGFIIEKIKSKIQQK